jgi:hypothetical protein
MTFENILTGKCFKVKQWEAKSGTKYSTFTFSYGKKKQDGTGWENAYVNITLFNDYTPSENEMIKISGKFEPKFYQKQDGTFVESIAFIAFKVLETDKIEDKALDLDDLSDDDLVSGLNPFNSDLDSYKEDETDAPF